MESITCVLTNNCVVCALPLLLILSIGEKLKAIDDTASIKLVNWGQFQWWFVACQAIAAAAVAAASVSLWWRLQMVYSTCSDPEPRQWPIKLRSLPTYVLMRWLMEDGTHQTHAISFVYCSSLRTRQNFHEFRKFRFGPWSIFIQIFFGISIASPKNCSRSGTPTE